MNFQLRIAFCARRFHPKISPEEASLFDWFLSTIAEAGVGHGGMVD
jgi:hypothetical protein